VGRNARRVRAVAVVILAVAVPVALIAVRRSPPSDRLLVQNLLKDAKEAVEAQDVRATMALISRNYKDDFGNSRDDLRAYAIAYYREADRISITLDQPIIHLDGPRAHVDVTVTLDVRTRGSLSSQRISIPVTLFLAKEPARRFLILPYRRWQVTSVSFAPPSDEMWMF